MRFFRLLFFIGITFLGLSACNDKPEKTDYFPLNEGLHWQYQFQLVTTSDKKESGIYTVTNLATTKVDNQLATVRRTNEGRDYYLTKTPKGIHRIASRTLFETHPDMDSPQRMVLPAPPYDVEKEHRWSSSSTSYVIHRIGPSTISSANPIKNFMMSYRIVSSDETVIVPAGKYENCLLVEGEATLTMFADPLTGYQDIPIKTREWYAPGVGLIKLERTEPLDTRVFKGGSYTFELLQFNG